MTEFSEYPTSWKLTLETLTGNVVVFEVHALMCAVLSKAEKHVPYGKVVCTT